MPKNIIRVHDEEIPKKTKLNKALIQGEKSGFVKEFNRDSFLNKLHKRYSKNEV